MRTQFLEDVHVVDREDGELHAELLVDFAFHKIEEAFDDGHGQFAGLVRGSLHCGGEVREGPVQHQTIHIIPIPVGKHNGGNSPHRPPPHRQRPMPNMLLHSQQEQVHIVRLVQPIREIVVLAVPTPSKIESSHCQLVLRCTLDHIDGIDLGPAIPVQVDHEVVGGVFWTVGEEAP